MQFKTWLKWFIFLIGLGFGFPSFGATCNIQSGSLPFSTYNVLQPMSQTVISTVDLTCTNPTTTESTNGVIVQVGLSSGQGTIANRYLSNGLDKLYYNIYEDAAYQVVLGLGSGNGALITTCLDAPACGNSTTNTTGSTLPINLYGAMPPNQDIPPGSYSDNLLLQITF